MATSPLPPATPAGAAPGAPAPVAPAPVAAAPAATPPAPPPPPPSSTSYAPWGRVPSLGMGVTGWYTNLYLILLAYLALPLLVVSWLNTSCSYGGIWVILLASTLFDLWLMFHPWVVGGVSFAGYLRGQIGGTPGPDMSEGIDTAWQWLKNAARATAATILAKQIGLIWLIFFPIRGFGGVALAVIALIVLVVIGVARYSETTWFARFCWKVYITLLVGLLGYWALAGSIMPELRHSRAHAVVSCLQEEVRSQNDADLHQKAEVVAAQMAKMAPSLTDAERIAKLSKEEQAIWAKATESGFVTKSVETVAPLVHKASEAIGEAMKKAKTASSTAAEVLNKGSGEAEKAKPTAAAAPAAPAPRLMVSQAFSWQSFTPSRHQKFLSLGTVPAGKYRILCEGTRQQRFLERGAYHDYAMDCAGVLIHNGMKPWVHPGTKPNEMPIPLPREAYGALFVATGGNLDHPQIAHNRSFTVQSETEVLVGINSSQADDLFDGGGTIRVRVEKQ